MTKETVHHLLDYRSRLIKYRDGLMIDYFNERGQMFVDFTAEKKRKINIELLNIQAFLAGVVTFRNNSRDYYFAKKYHELK